MSRKVNPKSLENLKKSSRRNGGGKVPKSISVPPEAIDLAEQLGDGNVSAGFSRLAQDHLFAQSPLFGRVKLFVERIAAQESPYTEMAQALLYELEDMEIEQTYKEAVLDGAIETPSGAYIL